MSTAEAITNNGDSPMQINTRFGAQEVDPASIIDFPLGLANAETVSLAPGAVPVMAETENALFDGRSVAHGIPYNFPRLVLKWGTGFNCLEYYRLVAKKNKGRRLTAERKTATRIATAWENSDIQTARRKAGKKGKRG